MGREILTIRCQRIKDRQTYNGNVRVDSEQESDVHQNVSILFKDKKLEDMGACAHHLLRAYLDNGSEMCVKMIKTAPNSTRIPVPIDLTPEQVNKIYDSEKSARAFFAPINAKR